MQIKKIYLNILGNFHQKLEIFFKKKYKEMKKLLINISYY